MKIYTWITAGYRQTKCKTLILLFASAILAFTTNSIKAQQTDITAAEYFWNTDPGMGNATPVAFTQGTSVDFTLNIHANSISQGLNWFYFRVKDANNQWSHTYNSPVWISQSNTGANTDIIKAEYFWDTDPGLNNANALNLTSGNAIDINNAINVNTLPTGLHYFYVRTLQSNGVWSHTFNSPVWVFAGISNTSTIAKAEYFWDTDPGTGSGNAISVTPGGTVDLTNIINTNSMSAGLHYFYIRTLDNNGVWSHTFNSPVWIFAGAANTNPEIVKAEYFWDTDPGMGNANALTVTAGKIVDLSDVISTSSVSSGLHYFYIRTLDNNGTWSHTFNSPLWIMGNTADYKIAKAEYFWDNDPGFGNGTTLSCTAAGVVDLTNVINTNSVTAGLHYFYIRTLGDNGIWSHTFNSPVWIFEDFSTLNPEIVKAEYFWDTDPGMGNGININVTASETIDLTNFISTNNISKGLHYFYIRTLDNNGRWSHTLNSPVWIDDVTSAGNIVAAEYFWNTDPGFGNGFPLPLAYVNPVIDGTFNVAACGLAAGTHKLYLRVKDDSEKWSHCFIKDVSVTDDGPPALPSVSISSSLSLCENNPATFAVTVSSGGTMYQWEESSDNGATWTTLSNNSIYSGVNQNNLNILNISAGMDDNLYRCVIDICSYNIISGSAALDVIPIPVIISQPTDIDACPGSSASLSITASNASTYQWYQNNGNGWVALVDAGVFSGVNTPSVNISNVNGMDNYYFRCIASGCGADITSDSAYINLLQLPAINSNPADVNVCPGTGVSFAITATDVSGYQWYENNGTGWNSLTNAGVYSGTSTDSLIISDNTGMNGFLYMCIVSGCGVNISSDTAIMNIFSAPVITANPFDVINCSGGTTFSVSASGVNLNYQWYENNGTGWSPVIDAGLYSGAQTSMLSISDASSLNSYLYQCIVSTCSYTTVSNPATLTYSNVNTWLGYTSEWNNNGNWSCGIPASTTNALVPGTPIGGVYPLIDNINIAECNNITIEANGQIFINNNKNLTVYGNWINNGSSDIGQGTVIFNGTIQDISGFTVFRHLNINAGSTTFLSSAQKISGILLCNGELITNNKLTLLSDASGTALINGAGTGTVSGWVTQQRFIPAAKAKGYKHFSSAFSDAFIGQFANFMTLYLGNTSNSPYPTLFKYSEAAATPYFSNGWIAAAPQGQTSALIDVARGYTAQLGTAGGNDITASMYGTVNNGNVNINITRNNPGSVKGDGWNLVGNPYPSPLDLDKLPYTAAHMNKSVSIFISTSMYNGYYGYYNATFHFPLNGGTRYLAPLNGFFVQCNNLSGGTLTFTNAMRSTNLNPVLYKNEEYPEIPVIILAASGSEQNALKDETAMLFANNATKKEDADYDAGKLFNTDPDIPNIYTISDSSKLAFNGLPDDFSENVIIPVGFTVMKNGNYNIEASQILNMPTGTDVFLEDKFTGNLQNLLTDPVYTFAADVNSPAEGRFFIRFNDLNTDIENYADNFSFSAWSTGNKLEVSVKGQQGKGTIQLFDALGRIVSGERINGDGKYTFSPGLPAGTYTVRYLGGENVRTVKVFLE